MPNRPLSPARGAVRPHADEDRSGEPKGCGRSFLDPRPSLGRRGSLLVDLDDHEAIGFLDDAPAGTAAGRVPASNRPAVRNVVGLVLLFPRHVDDGIAVGGSALAAPGLWRLPTGAHLEREPGVQALRVLRAFTAAVD